MQRKIRVLYVEDDIIMAMEVKVVLEAMDFEVVDPVSTGVEAIKSTRLCKPDIVIIDIRLKGNMNGIEAAREIRLFSDVPIIFLTGYKNIDIMDQASRVRRSLFLTKPFDPGKLVASIETFCAR